MSKENWFQKNMRLAGAYSYKSLKSMPGQEGTAWSGNLCFQGKEIGFVRDAAYGGELEVTIKPEYKEQVAAASIAYYKESPDAEPITDETFKYVSAEEFFLPWLADWQDNLKKLKAKCKTRVLTIDDTCKEGESIGWAAGSINQIDRIKAKFPDRFYLNDQF
jgi:hypothetical protein